MNALTIKEYTNKQIKAANMLHGNLQLHSNSGSINGEYESATVSYPSTQSFHDHLMYAAMQQGSIFEAVSLLHSVGKLNGGKRVLSDYQMAEVKKHFNQKDRGSNNGKGNVEVGDSRKLKNKVESFERVLEDTVNAKIKFGTGESQSDRMCFRESKVEKLQRDSNRKMENQIGIVIKGFGGIENDLKKIKFESLESHSPQNEMKAIRNKEIKVVNVQKVRRDMIKGYVTMLTN